MHDQVLQVVTRAVEELNESRQVKVLVEQGETAPLYGRGAPLDSLGLVSLILAIEQLVADELNRNITIADERAVSQQRSPFRTIGSLTSYITERLQEAA